MSTPRPRPRPTGGSSPSRTTTGRSRPSSVLTKSISTASQPRSRPSSTRSSTRSSSSNDDDAKRRREERDARIKAAQEAQNGGQETGQKNKSLWGQATQAFTSAPLGAIEFVAGAAQEPYHWARGAVASTGLIENKADTSGNWFQDIQAGFREYSPLLADMGTQVADTGKLVEPLTRGDIRGSWRQIQEASDEGRTVDEILGHVGTLSMGAGGVGGIAGKIGTAARVGSAGSKLNRATRTSIRRPANAASRNPRPQATNKISSATRPLDVSGRPDLAQASTITSQGSGIAGALWRRNMRQHGMDYTRKVPSADRVQRVGDVARKFSLAADLVDPSEALITGVAKGLNRAPSVIGKTARAVSSTAAAQSLSNRSEARRIAAEGRAVAEDVKTVQQRAAIAPQRFAEENFKNAGIADPELRNLYGGIVLNLLDRRLDPILKGWDKLPESSREAVLRRFNERLPEDTWVTVEEINAFNDYQSGRLDSQTRRIIEETENRMRRQVRERTEQQQLAGVLLDDQLEIPTVRREIDVATGEFLDQLDPLDAADRRANSEIETQDFPTTRMSQDVLDLALAEGRLDLPYREAKLAEFQARFDKERTGYEAELAAVNTRVADLDSRAGVSEAVRRSLTEAGTDPNFRDTTAGRKQTANEAERRHAELERELDDLLDLEGYVEGQDQQQFLAQRIEQVTNEMIGTRNVATRAELDARTSGMDVVDEMAKWPKKKLRALADERGIVGRSRMNKRSLAEALNPALDPAIRVSADIELSKAQERLERLNSAVAPEKPPLERIEKVVGEPVNVIVKAKTPLRSAVFDVDADIHSVILETVTDNPDFYLPGESVGEIAWRADTGEVIEIEVTGKWQRQGVATAIEELARGFAAENGWVDPVGSSSQTGPGAAWRASIDARNAQPPKLSQAVQDARDAADAAVENITQGVNTNADGMWVGEDSGYLTEPNPRSFQEGVPEDAMPFNPDEYYGNVPDSSIGAPPVDRTRPAGSPAMNLAEQQGRFNQQLEDAVREQWILEQRIESVNRRSANLEKTLNMTQQNKLRSVNNQFISNLKGAVNTLVPAGVKVGEYVPSDIGPGGRITGVIGDLSAKWKIVGKVIKRIEDMERTQRLLEAEFYKEWVDRQRKFGKDDAWIQDEANAWMWESYIQKRMPKETVGSINIAARAFQEVVAEGAARDAAWGQALPAAIEADMATFYQALTADELSRDLDRYAKSPNELIEFSWEDLDQDISQNQNKWGVMKGFEMFKHIQSRIAELPPKMAQHAQAQGVVDAIDLAEQEFTRQYNHQLEALNDQTTAAIPAPYRAPILQARRMVKSVMQEAISEFEKGNLDTARALELTINDTPTSFEAFASTQSLDTTRAPTHLSGGSLERAQGGWTTGSDGRLNIPEVKATERMRTGARVRSLREYSRIEAREMTNLAVGEGIRQISVDPRYSASLLDIIGDRVNQWIEDARGPLTWRDMNEMLQAEGYAIIEDSMTDLREIKQEVRFEQGLEVGQVPQPDGTTRPNIDPSGTERTGAIMGSGRNIELNEIPDPSARNYRNGLDEFPDVRVVPQRLAEQLDLYKNYESGRFLTWLDQTTQMWKIPTLAWSPKWIIYNTTGNLLMATFSAGMSPARLVSSLSRINNARMEMGNPLNKGAFDGLVPDRLETSGLSWEEQAASGKQADVETKTGRIVDWMSNPERSRMGRATTAMYGANSFVDNWLKTAVYLDQLDKRLPEVPKDLLNPDGTLRNTFEMTPDELSRLGELDDAAAAAVNDSTRAALNTMGDFTRLTPFERNIVKRFFPFYPWLRHQTSMTFRMPIGSPLRFAFMASLDNIIGDDDQTEVGKLASRLWSTPFGDIDMTPASPFGTGGLTAFADTSGGQAGKVISSEGIIGSLNPVVKYPFSTIGFDSRGGEISRPYEYRDKIKTGFGSTPRYGPLNRLLDLDVKGALGESAYQAAAQFGPTRGIRDVLLSAPAFPGGEPRARWESGDTISGIPNEQRNLPLQIMDALRIPAPRDETYRKNIAAANDAKASAAWRREQTIRQRSLTRSLDGN